MREVQGQGQCSQALHEDECGVTPEVPQTQQSPENAAGPLPRSPRPHFLSRREELHSLCFLQKDCLKSEETASSVSFLSQDQVGGVQMRRMMRNKETCSMCTTESSSGSVEFAVGDFTVDIRHIKKF